MRGTMDIPPIGTYNPSDTDSQNGTYILSNYKTLGIKRFGPKVTNATDSLFARQQASTPGPGHYVARSDFGTLSQTTSLKKQYGNRLSVAYTGDGARPRLLKGLSHQTEGNDLKLSDRMDQLRLQNNRSVQVQRQLPAKFIGGTGEAPTTPKKGESMLQTYE